MASAINKTYFQQFPNSCAQHAHQPECRRDQEFIAQQQDKVVIKPLQGSGGAGVFLIREDEAANVNQMIEAVIRDGYCIVQEYLRGPSRATCDCSS